MSAKTDQARRFEETARELGCDEDPKAFEAAFAKIVPPKAGNPPKPRSKKPDR